MPQEGLQPFLRHEPLSGPSNRKCMIGKGNQGTTTTLRYKAQAEAHSFLPSTNSTRLSRAQAIEGIVATTSTSAEILPRARAPFSARHRSDHDFFATYVALIWLAVL